MSSLQRFLSIPDVAEVLHVSVRQVRSLLTSGELRGIQVGGRGVWRIEKSELERYINQQYDRSEQLWREQENSSASSSVSSAGPTTESHSPTE